MNSIIIQIGRLCTARCKCGDLCQNCEDEDDSDSESDNKPGPPYSESSSSGNDSSSEEGYDDLTSDDDDETGTDVTSNREPSSSLFASRNNPVVLGNSGDEIAEEGAPVVMIPATKSFWNISGNSDIDYYEKEYKKLHSSYSNGEIFRFMKTPHAYIENKDMVSLYKK